MHRDELSDNLRDVVGDAYDTDAWRKVRLALAHGPKGVSAFTRHLLWQGLQIGKVNTVRDAFDDGMISINGSAEDTKAKVMRNLEKLGFAFTEE